MISMFGRSPGSQIMPWSRARASSARPASTLDLTSAAADAAARASACGMATPVSRRARKTAAKEIAGALRNGVAIRGHVPSGFRAIAALGLHRETGDAPLRRGRRSDRDDLRPKRSGERNGGPSVGGRLAHQTGEFEPVGGDDVRLPHEFGLGRLDVRAHIGAGFIADDRIAQIERIGVGRLHALDRVGDGVRLVRLRKIARNHRVAAFQPAALVQRTDKARNQLRVERAALDLAVARMMGEEHRRHLPDLMAEPLHRKGRRRIADRAIDDLARDGKDRRHSCSS